MSTAPLPSPSFSESALGTPAAPRVAKLRPSRFIQPMTPSASSSSTHQWDAAMSAAIAAYDTHAQKVYMEGYLMHQQKKVFMELCGTTLALWDVDRPGATVLPDYVPLRVDTCVRAAKKQQFVVDLAQKKQLIAFDTLDPTSLPRWIAAIRLAGFERHLLHRQFTFALFQQRLVSNSAVSAASASFLHVKFPHSPSKKNEWQKQWVIIAKPSKRTQQQPTLSFFDNKKQKTANCTVTRIKHAYALYPENASLIAQTTLIRMEVEIDASVQELLLMTDAPSQLVPWLGALYKTFQLYGYGSHGPAKDQGNPMALNFGANVRLDTLDVVHALSLDAMPTEVVHARLTDLLCHRQMPTVSTSSASLPMPAASLHPAAISTAHPTERPVSPLAYTMSPVTMSPATMSPHDQPLPLPPQVPFHHNDAQMRTNSLPTIMVESIDAQRQRATSDAGLLKKDRLPLLSNVADSSDESDDGSDDDDDDDDDQDNVHDVRRATSKMVDEDDDEVDSDDEPIAKCKSLEKAKGKANSSGAAAGTTPRSSLIPDFDFESDSLLLPLSLSTSSSSSSSRPRQQSTPSLRTSHLRRSHQQQHQQQLQQPQLQQNQQNQQSRSSSSMGSTTSSSTASSHSSSSNHGANHTSTDPLSSLFGDLSVDFANLDPTHGLPKLTPQDRKYSLPVRPSWDSAWPEKSPRTRYLLEDDDEDALYGDDEADGASMRRGRRLQQDDEDEVDDEDDDDDCPLIPALHDHFAPQNSLLDNRMSEQLSAKEQIEFARQTGQPLIQIPTKPRGPKGGLVGVISERERNRRQGNGSRVAERIQLHDRFEREKERRIWEQRHQLFMKQQIMMYNSGYMHPMMVHPYMPPPSPMMSPGSPHSMPPSPNGYYYGRPYSPTMSHGSVGTYPPSPSSPHAASGSNGGGGSTGSTSSNGGNRRMSSRTVLEQDEPLYSQPPPRTGSPPIYRKMSSPASSSIQL